MINFILLFDIVNLVQNYGIVFTVVVLAIFVSYMLIKNSLKRIREQEKKIDSLYQKIDDLMTKFKSDDNNDLPEKFINYAENSNKIRIQIYHLLQVFDADRVSIFEFHNGGKNLAGVEFKKCSNTFEAVSLEIKPIMKEMQNLPLNMNPLWNKILATREDIIIPYSEKLEDSFFKSYLENQCIKSYYSTILQDYDNSPIGFMSVEYYRHYKELTTEQLDEFYEIAIKTSLLINTK